MLIAENRPRTLKWYHAGPLLFGDWGTSRLYVLGLAFYYTAHASLLYLGVMSLIMIAVAWAYTVVCRCFPEGGGVYTAARRISPLLAVVAATLLLCDFIVTASLSVIEGFHYFGVTHELVVPLSMVTIAGLGVVNWLGARSAGRFALIIAVVAIAASFVIGLMCLPLLPKGLSSVKATVPGVDTPWPMWESLVRVVLALSGVEAVANMTGLMTKPVARTAKRTIWPVLFEVVALNLVFGIALNALPGRGEQAVPHYVEYELKQQTAPENVPDDVKEYRDTAVKLLADHSASDLMGPTVGRYFGIGAGIVFGLLLLSAVNTAIMAMVSVLYSLAQDKELPRPLTRLNYSGVPWVGLLIATAAPAVILPFTSDPKTLGEMYAIGVVGAIAINVLCCAYNKDLPISKRERIGMWSLGGLMATIEATIVVAKPHATIFAGTIIALVLIVRYFVGRRRPVEPLPIPIGGWLEELRSAARHVEGAGPRLMLAARGRDNAEFAVDLAKKRGASLFAIYVRTLRIMDVQPGRVPSIEDDHGAQEALGTVAVLARGAGVAFVPIYVTSPDIAYEILDYTATYGCDTLIMGRSRRSLLSRKVSGDVVGMVAEQMPEGVSLIARAARKDAPREAHVSGSITNEHKD
jgi:amino acid transporter/nucleotide-binding universal stress UspA family protein